MHPVPAAERLRVVLDTNIYIAAFVQPNGRNGKLWRAARVGRYHLLSSPCIIGEMARVLRLDFYWPDAIIQSRVRIVAQVAEVISTRITLNVVAADRMTIAFWSAR